MILIFCKRKYPLGMWFTILRTHPMRHRVRRAGRRQGVSADCPVRDPPAGCGAGWAHIRPSSSPSGAPRCSRRSGCAAPATDQRQRTGKQQVAKLEAGSEGKALGTPKSEMQTQIVGPFGGWHLEATRRVRCDTWLIRNSTGEPTWGLPLFQSQPHPLFIAIRIRTRRSWPGTPTASVMMISRDWRRVALDTCCNPSSARHSSTTRSRRMVVVTRIMVTWTTHAGIK